MKPARNPAIGCRFAGRLIAVSISAAEDTERLGFPKNQLDRVLEAVLTPLVSDGARVAYGGRITLPEGMERNYTLEIAGILGEAYRRLDMAPGQRPFVHFIAQHRLIKKTTPGEVLSHLRALAPYGEGWLMDAQGVGFIGAFIGEDMGQPTFVLKPHPAASGAGAERETFRNEAELVITKAYLRLSADVCQAGASFERMREAMTVMCDARIVVGGRFTGSAGPMPGLADEALRSIARRQPLVVLGGFGGSARDIAIALGLLDAGERVPRPVYPDAERYEAGMAALAGERAEFEQTAGAHLPLLRQLAAEDSVVGATSGLIRYLLDSHQPSPSTDVDQRQG